MDNSECDFDFKMFGGQDHEITVPLRILFRQVIKI